MQFLILAYDGTDADAPARRVAARPRHMGAVPGLIEEGKAVMGAAILNDQDGMIGSMMLMDFPDRASLDAWLATEPYVTEKVWERVEVLPCRVAEPFLKR